MAAAKSTKKIEVTLPWNKTTSGGMQEYAVERGGPEHVSNVYVAKAADFPAGGSVKVTVEHIA